MQLSGLWRDRYGQTTSRYGWVGASGIPVIAPGRIFCIEVAKEKHSLIRIGRGTGTSTAELSGCHDGVRLT